MLGSVIIEYGIEECNFNKKNNTFIPFLKISLKTNELASDALKTTNSTSFTEF